MSAREAVSVAYVKKAHALEGELFVQIETDYPEQVFVENRTFRVSGGGPIGFAGELTLVRARPHAGGWILEFEEIGDRTAAERYKGRRLSLSLDELVERGEDEFFLHELDGVEVVGPGGERLGAVRAVYPTAGRPLLGIDGDGEERLLPFVRDFVEEVDLEEGIIRVRPPPGLMEL